MGFAPGMDAAGHMSSRGAGCRARVFVRAGCARTGGNLRQRRNGGRVFARRLGNGNHRAGAAQNPLRPFPFFFSPAPGGRAAAGCPGRGRAVSARRKPGAPGRCAYHAAHRGRLRRHRGAHRPRPLCAGPLCLSLCGGAGGRNAGDRGVFGKAVRRAFRLPAPAGAAASGALGAGRAQRALSAAPERAARRTRSATTAW